MFIILFYSIFVDLSIEECLYEKVAITIDLIKEPLHGHLEANSGQLLWHVAILKQEDTVKFLCSGTIVGPSHVITAASCVVNVSSSQLRVAAGLKLLRSVHNSVDNPHSVFNVVKKYYQYQQGNFVKDGLAVLKLRNKAAFRHLQLTTLDMPIKYSAHCFTLGWGLQNELSDSSSCPNPSFQDFIISIINPESKQFQNKILNMHNFMGLSSMLIFQLNKILDIFPGFSLYKFGSKYSQDRSCTNDGHARVKATWMSTKHPFKCLCQTNGMCLYSKGTENIAQKLDIGSPVLCKLKTKTGKEKSESLQTRTSNFVLSGVITNKETKKVHWLKCESFFNMITATDIAVSTDFISAVLMDKD